MKQYLLPFIILLIVNTGFGQDKIKSNLLLPETGVIPNWHMKDSVETYSGDNLFLYINGGADLYLEYGFEEVSTCKYLNYAGNNIHIDIYQMTDEAAAFGIFSINSSVHGKPVDFGTKSLLYDYYLDIWKGNYFIRCTANKKENGMVDTLQLFVRHIDEKIEIEGKLPALSSAYKLNGIEFKSVKYVEGIIGLGNVYNFGHGSVAGFHEGLIGKWEDKTAFVFAYENDFKSREWFASAKGKMQMSKKFSDYLKIEDGFTVKDKSGNFLCFKSYKRFMLIIKGLNWEEAKPLFSEIQENLDGMTP